MPCTTFQQLSVRTWGRMQNNLNTPILLREDGITSLNLQDIYNNLKKDILVIDFSPQVESSTTGADWEWWFLSKSGAFGAAVQAKCLSSKNTYDVGYTPKKSGYPQIERLLDYSVANDITPMYCFYNWFSSIPTGVSWPCGSFPQKDDLWGCALTDAWTIYSYHLKSQYSANVYLSFSEPWHCLTCCQPSGAELGSRAFAVAKRLVNKGRTSSATDYPTIYKQTDIRSPIIHKSLPDRVSKLIQMGRNENIDHAIGEMKENMPRRLVLMGDINLYI